MGYAIEFDAHSLRELASNCSTLEQQHVCF